MEKPIELTDANFGEETKTGLVLVDFWAPWCGPCRMIAPVVEQLAGEYAGKVKFCKLNIDESPVTASKYGIMSIPTLLIFKNGKVSGNLVGAVPKQQIDEKLKAQL